MSKGMTDSDILAIKLRKTKIQKDASAPLLETSFEREGLHKHQNSILDMNIEVWYEILKDTTFPTKFYPITIQHANLLTSCYKTVVKEKKPLSSKQKLNLEELENGLQRVIDDVRGSDACVFVKTSCRSPKDTVIHSSRFKDLYKTSLNSKPTRSENDKIASLLDAAVELLKTQSAAELLNSFISSERIYQDMILGLDQADRFHQHFAIRKWIPIKPEMEFRGFYNNGKLNALSQYNCCCFYTIVAENCRVLEENILQFFNKQVEPRLKLGQIESCVVDFAVTDESFSEVFVIELNPFVFTTDGCLFSWTNERHLLENGPFEFRFQTKEFIGAMVTIEENWRKIVSEVDNESGSK